jgi:hypothetical protein
MVSVRFSPHDRNILRVILYLLAPIRATKEAEMEVIDQYCNMAQNSLHSTLNQYRLWLSVLWVVRFYTLTNHNIRFFQ